MKREIAAGHERIQSVGYVMLERVGEWVWAEGEVRLKCDLSPRLFNVFREGIVR